MLALLVAGAVTLWHCRARLFPDDKGSEVFQRYEHHPGIDADYIKNFRINDTITANVTLLEAKDSIGWALLRKDFDIKVLPPEIMQLLEPDSININVIVKLFPKNHPGLPTDTNLLNNDAAVISRAKQSVYVFHLTSEKQYYDIVYRNVYDLTTQTANQ